MRTPNGHRGGGWNKHGPGNTGAGQFPSILNGFVFSLWAAKCPNVFLAGSISPWGHREDPPSVEEQILHGPDAATFILSKWCLSQPHPTGMAPQGCGSPQGVTRSRGLSVAHFNGDLFGANQGISPLPLSEEEKTSNPITAASS